MSGVGGFGARRGGGRGASGSGALRIRSRVSSAEAWEGGGTRAGPALRDAVSTPPMRIGSGRREKRRAQRHELPALQVAEHLGLAALHAEQVGGAGHVDVEEGAAHQEVRGLGGHVLGELGEALRGDDAGEAALPAAAHQIGHGAERAAAGLVGGLARHGGGEELRLIHHHHHRRPGVALHLEHAVEEGGGAAELGLDLDPFQVEHDGDAVPADALRDPGQGLLGMVLGVDHQVPVAFGEGDEIPLGIDHHLLHPGRALFQQAAEQVGLAGA